VLAPVELREKMAEIARAMAAHYDGVKVPVVRTDQLG
jgi:hypothetical protein